MKTGSNLPFCCAPSLFYVVWRIKRQITLIFRFIVLFWATTRIGLHVLILKEHRSFLTLAPVSLSPASCIPSPLWLVSSHMPETELITTTEQLCRISSFMPNKPLAFHSDKYVTWWCCVMSQSYRDSRRGFWQGDSGEGRAVIGVDFLHAQ